MRGGDGGTGVERVRGVGGGFEEIVKAARHGLRVMIDRGQPPIGIDADLKPLPGGRAMADRPVHLLAAQHQLDRPADQPGGQDAEHLRPGDHALRSEAAAEKRTANLDLVGRDAEQPRDPALRHRQALARRIDRQGIALPGRHDGVRLHGIVVLGRRLIGRIDARRGDRKACLDIAAAHGRGIADANRLWDETLAAIKTYSGGLRFIVRRQQRGALGGRLEGLGDHHRDRLVDVAHPIVLQQVEAEHERIGLGVRVLGQRRPVGGGHDLDDARVALGRRDVERGHTTARDAADCQHRMQHPGRVVVGGVAGLSGDLQDAVAAGQRLPDARAMPDMRRRLGRTEVKRCDVRRCDFRRCDFRRHGALPLQVQKAMPEARPCALAFPPRRASGHGRRSVSPVRS